MKRSSIATLRNTIAFMICRAMKTVMNVPVRAHVAMVMTFDLSMLEMSGCCYCMIAWTVSVEDSNEDYSKHTPFPSREVRPTVVTAPYYIPDEALMITRSQAQTLSGRMLDMRLW
jgi:hypothetical protein